MFERKRKRMKSQLISVIIMSKLWPFLLQNMQLEKIRFVLYVSKVSAFMLFLLTVLDFLFHL